MRAQPAAPRYVHWHLARFVKTLGIIANELKPGTQWLDLSSDPWFCMLAFSEFGVSPVPTGYGQSPIRFSLPDGKAYHYEPLPLEIRESDRRYNVGDGFDLVTAFELLEHLPFQPSAFFAAIHHALRTGGKLVLSTPNITSWSAISRLLDGEGPYQTPHFAGPMSHAKEYSPPELSELAVEAGLRVEGLRTFNCYLNDRRGLRSALSYWAVVLWHGAVFQAGRVRNLLYRSGSTMLMTASRSD